MAQVEELIPCPGNCGNHVHCNAKECPRCGYQSERGWTESLLGGLGTISSILAGFGLSTLAQLATADTRDQLSLQFTIGVWVITSLLLLGVLVGSEVLRGKDTGIGRMQFGRKEYHRLWRQSEWLLWIFVFALVGTAGGIVLFGFYFSWWHGGAGLVTLLFIAFVLYWIVWNG